VQRRPIVALRERAVMSNCSGAGCARCTNGNVSDLAVLREIAEQDKVPDSPLKRLLMQLRLEDRMYTLAEAAVSGTTISRCSRPRFLSGRAGGA
jgi:hypothetical protein